MSNRLVYIDGEEVMEKIQDLDYYLPFDAEEKIIHLGRTNQKNHFGSSYYSTRWND